MKRKRHPENSVKRFGNFKLYLILIIAVIMAIGLYYKRTNIPQFFYKEITKLIDENVTSVACRNDSTAPVGAKRKKVILFWVPYYSLTFYGFGPGQEAFVNNRCPVRNCVTTSDRRRLLQADAIVFHIRNIGRTSNWKSLVRFLDVPRRKFPKQRWVFFLKEPPPYTGLALAPFRGLFNWTMTYLKDSDFYAPYGKTFRRETPDPSPLDWRVYAKPNSPSTVAWMVSHCSTASHREDYVKQLTKYIPVDIYGGCGDLKCNRRSDLQCFVEASKKYKFYLSFENSLCQDYVTEKLWNILAKTTMVPIVFGGADYEADAPPNSFIDARRYSPEKLADYLKLLDSNDDLYLKYHEWRRKYYVVSYPNANDNDAFCRLCASLNDESLTPKWIEDINEFWSKDRCS